MKFHYFSLHFKIDDFNIIDIGYARTSKKLKVLCKKLGAKVEEDSSSTKVPYFFIKEHMFEYKNEFNKQLVNQCMSMINDPDKSKDSKEIEKIHTKSKSDAVTKKVIKNNSTTKVTINGVDCTKHWEEMEKSGQLFDFSKLISIANKLKNDSDQIKLNDMHSLDMETDSRDEDSDLEKFL